MNKNYNALICSNHCLADLCKSQHKRIKQLERSVTMISDMHTKEEWTSEARRKSIVAWNSIDDKNQSEIARLKKVVRDLNLEIANIKYHAL
jgi:hypothetical protein